MSGTNRSAWIQEWYQQVDLDREVVLSGRPGYISGANESTWIEKRQQRVDLDRGVVPAIGDHGLLDHHSYGYMEDDKSCHALFLDSRNMIKLATPFSLIHGR